MQPGKWLILLLLVGVVDAESPFDLNKFNYEYQLKKDAVQAAVAENRWNLEWHWHFGAIGLVSGIAVGAWIMRRRSA